MGSTSWLATMLAALALLLGQLVGGSAIPKHLEAKRIAPKVMIVSMFKPEANVWYANMPSHGFGDLLAVNVSTPGLWMLSPYIHCVADLTICQVTTGEAEINAAATMMATLMSPQFDFTKTYFLLGGIAGANPKYATLGGVALARFAVQVALQYEFDAREMPENFSTPYFPLGTSGPGQYPNNHYGTEVIELNVDLRDAAYALASKANLLDHPAALEYRSRYRAQGAFSAGYSQPAVVKCDTATADVYYSGTLLSEAFENVTTEWTNGTGKYCMTAQEDNAVLEVLVRMAVAELVDFGRVILMRTGSDFDRPPPGVSAYDHLVVLEQSGFKIATENIFRAGAAIVRGIIDKWNCTFEEGIPPTNYIGDIFGSLGGEPDFGPGSWTKGKGGNISKRGEISKRGAKVASKRPLVCGP